MITIDNWNNYDKCIFVYIFTNLRFILDSPLLSFITINDKLVAPHLSFEINLNMAPIATECTHFL